MEILTRDSTEREKILTLQWENELHYKCVEMKRNKKQKLEYDVRCVAIYFM